MHLTTYKKVLKTMAIDFRKAFLFCYNSVIQAENLQLVCERSLIFYTLAFVLLVFLADSLFNKAPNPNAKPEPIIVIGSGTPAAS